MMEDNLAYLLDGKIYVNLTNKCTNDCIFCIRSLKEDVCGKNLWLKSEDFNACDVIAQIEKLDCSKDEVIFCGYGEPTIKLSILIEVARYLKEKYPSIKIRLNTNGHGNFINKEDILPKIKGFVDEISVSLNAENADLYNELSQPKIKDAYEEVKKFIETASKSGVNVIASVVSGYKNYDVDLEECRKIASELGADFRERK